MKPTVGDTACLVLQKRVLKISVFFFARCHWQGAVWQGKLMDVQNSHVMSESSSHLHFTLRRQQASHAVVGIVKNKCEEQSCSG
jgi:hypothetical protein